MDQPSIHRPAGLKVTYRRMKFPFEDKGFDRYWHGGSPFKSLFWTQLSTAFEPGEKFFIDSARALKDQIQDPALLEELTEFCRQEGHHTAQHLKFDRQNESLGIDILGCRKRYAKVIDRVRELGNPMQMLAATAALEHFTAGIADRVLQDPRLFEGSDAGVEALWRWHAAEEVEHKATCFDLYRQLGGKYPQRLGLLFGAWTEILRIAMINTYVLLWKDGKLFTWDTVKGHWYLLGPHGVISRMLPAFLAYFSPRFHPWNNDTSAQIRAWEAGNRQYVVNGSHGAAATGQA